MDLDPHYPIGVCPPYEPVLAWILSRPPGEDVVSIGVHIEMLGRMRDAKRAGLPADLFGQILFVYLHSSDPARQLRFLNLANAHGHERDQGHVRAVLRNYHAVHAACDGLADETIDAARLSMDNVVERVAAFRDALLQQSR